MPDNKKAPLDTPEREETELRRRSRFLRHLGWIGMALAFGSALTGAITGIYAPAISPNVRLFATLAILALVGAGAVLLGVGYAERLQRPQRASLLAHARHDQARDARLERIEQAIDLIAGYMPEFKEKVKWGEFNQGYNEAVKDGFVAATGTNDAGRRHNKARLHTVRRPDQL